MGFFADAGPLQLFVSNHLIPEDFEFSAAGDPAFVSADEAVRITAGAEVRLRIVGTRMDANEIVRTPPFLSSPWNSAGMHHMPGSVALHMLTFCGVQLPACLETMHCSAMFCSMLASALLPQAACAALLGADWLQKWHEQECARSMTAMLWVAVLCGYHQGRLPRRHQPVQRHAGIAGGSRRVPHEFL